MAIVAVEPAASYARRHFQFGWWSFLIFATAGLALEMLHGFKAGLYLDASQDTRRLMWTLAHAHGTLLSLVHVIFALAVRALPALGGAHLQLISRCLVGASILLPGGFFLGGIRFYAGDPGLGIVLVPPGAVLLLVAIFLIARSSGHILLADREGPTRNRRDS